MTDLLYPSNPGCAGGVQPVGGSPRPCEAEPTLTVRHDYRYPRSHSARLLACPVHAEGEPDPQPLTDADRVELAHRRRRHAEAVKLRDTNRRAEQ